MWDIHVLIIILIWKFSILPSLIKACSLSQTHHGLGLQLHCHSLKTGLDLKPIVSNSFISSPTADDCCPICFGSFSVPCHGPCGHWYCGGCIMEYWKHVAAFKPCKCPMCSGSITKLTPEATLSHQQDAGIHEVLKNVRQYNCLFAGGACGFILQVLQLPLFIKRLIQAMMDPDRPVAYLSRLRLVAVKQF